MEIYVHKKGICIYCSKNVQNKVYVLYQTESACDFFKIFT